MIRENRVIRGKRRGNDFENADAGSCQSAIDAANEACSVRGIRAVKHGRLLHRPAVLPAADNFKHVAHAATEFSFRLGAAGKQGNGD